MQLPAGGVSVVLRVELLLKDVELDVIDDDEDEEDGDEVVDEIVPLFHSVFAAFNNGYGPYYFQ